MLLEVVMQIRPEKLDYLNKALETLWDDCGLNKAMATDLDIYIVQDLPDHEPDWSLYNHPLNPSVGALSNLSNAILTDPDFCDYLRRFLLVLINTKQYDMLYVFFDKAFINHVCNVVYNSKNANSYSLMERSFDRFVEAMKFSKIQNDEMLPALFDITNSYEGQLHSRWQRPAKDFLSDYANQNEEELLLFLKYNFESYGVFGLNFLSTIDLQHSVDVAIDWYLNKNDCKQEIAQFMQKNNDICVKTINKMLHNKDISNEQYVDLMLVFVEQKNLNNEFTQIFNTIANNKQKSKILDSIHIKLEKRLKNLAAFVKAVNRFKFEDKLVLGKNLTQYSSVLLASDDFPPPNTTEFLITQFQELYSPKATFELSYFRELLSQKTLDDLSQEVYEQFVLNGTPEDEWAIALIASISSDKCLSDILMTTSDLYEGEKGDIVKTLVNITVVSKGQDIKFVLQNLDKHNLKYDKVISYILDSVQKNNIFSYSEFELLADRLVPNFDFDSTLSSSIDFDGSKFGFLITKDCNVQILENTKPLIQVDPKTRENVYDFKNRIDAELQKQKQRLKSAFTNNRRWSSEDFDNIILKNPVLYCLAQGLLWAKYFQDKVIEVFKLEDWQIQKVMNINNATSSTFSIGIFHPLEAPDYNWKGVFEGKFTTFNQLDRQVFSLQNYSAMSSFVARFNGMIVNGTLFVRELKNMGWIEGQYQKPMGLVSMLKLNSVYNIICEIEFCSNHLDDLSEITMKELRFYSLNNAKYQNNTWKIDKVNAKALKTLPPRFFSDIVFEVSTACKK